MSIYKSLDQRLNDSSLLVSKALVGNDWVKCSESGNGFNVVDPSTEGVIVALPDCGVPEIRTAIAQAKLAQKKWASLSAKERFAILQNFYNLVIANAEDLAAIITAEMGKPFLESKAEVFYGASYIEWFAEESKRIYGDIIPGHGKDKRISVIRQPVGVVAGIASWNFPNAMFARKLAPALASGCSFIFKPAAETPLSALALVALGERAGLPKGLVSVITTSNAKQFGEEVCKNDAIKKLTFTGSTRVGRLLMQQASSKVLRLSMELGGNAPFIVFDDADLEAAVEGAMVSKFRNAGQTCVCANRIYVQAGIHDRFVEALKKKVSDLKISNGFEDGCNIGPLINDSAVIKYQDHIDDALSKGAKIEIGGHVHERGGTFVYPSIITKASQNMKVAREETFAPLAAIFKFDTAEEVVELANDTEYGLAAYLYSESHRNIVKVSEALEYGMVGINTGLISTEVAPFGGIKQSGFGREGSKYGLDDYVNLKYLCVGGIN